MKRISLCVVCLIVLFFANLSYADVITYSHNFEDSNNDSNWTELYGSWSFGESSSDPGNRVYTGVADDAVVPAALSMVNSIPNLTSAGISLYAIFSFGGGTPKVDNNTGIFFSLDEAELSKGNYIGYVAEIYYHEDEDDPNEDGWYFFYGDESHQADWPYNPTKLLGVNSDTIFGVSANIDTNNNLTWAVYKYAGTTPSLVASGSGYSKLLPLIGSVGFFTHEADGAELRYFEVSGETPSDQPASMPWISLLLLNSIPESPSTCGAYIAPGVWKEFDCYNVAAIGRTTGDDPFTPSWRLNGGYWQWGRKGPDSSQWYTTNTMNYAHGPTGPDVADANSDAISGWDTSNAPNGSWSDSTKTANDPCPEGYRIPTISQWQGVLNNNSQSLLGTWTYNATNYSSGLFWGSNLMLPAAGHRSDSTGSLPDRGSYGYYWSSTESSSSSDHAWFLSLSSRLVGLIDYNRNRGISVRCIAE